MKRGSLCCANSHKSAAFKSRRGSSRIWSQVGSLTLAARDPASPCSPCCANSHKSAAFKSRRGLKQFRPLHSLPIKKAPKRVLFNWRRGRDLNPRNLAVYRFSRPAVSTTHTPLQLYRCRVAGAGTFFYCTKFSTELGNATHFVFP